MAPGGKQGEVSQAWDLGDPSPILCAANCWEALGNELSVSGPLLSAYSPRGRSQGISKDLPTSI